MNALVHASAVPTASDNSVGAAGGLCAFPISYLGYAYFDLFFLAGDT